MNETRMLAVMRWSLGLHLLFLPVSIALSQAPAYLASLVAGWLAWRSWRGGARPARMVAWAWPMLAFLVVVLLSCLWSIRPLLSVSKLDRLLLLGVLLALPMVWRSAGGDRAVFARRCVLLFLVGVTVQAAISVIQIPWSYFAETASHEARVAAGELSARAKRPTLFDMGNMRDPQMLMVSLSLLTGLYLYRTPAFRLAWYVPAVMLNAAAFILHFKRGAWIAFLASALLMALVAGRRRLILILLLLAAGAAALPPVRARVEQVRREEFRVKTGGRYALWTRIAKPMLADHPWGLGWKAARHEDFRAYGVWIQPKLKHLHNNLLQVRLETGVPGVVLWMTWMGMALGVMARNFRRHRRDAPAWAGISFGVLGAFLALQLNGLVEFNFGDAEIFMLMNFLLALSILGWAERRDLPGPAAGPSASPAPAHGS